MKKNKINWIVALISSLISFVLIGLIFLNPVDDPDYAGARFAYNLTFFFPILLLIIVSVIVGFVFTIKYLRNGYKNDGKYKLFKLITPLIFLSPAILQISFFVLSTVIMLFSLYFPKDYKPEFTTIKLDLNNGIDKVYIHGSMYGEYHIDRNVYISIDSVPFLTPDTLKHYFYKGQNELGLFYLSKSDTLTVYIPVGFKIHYPVNLRSNVIIEQIEYDEKGNSKLEDLYNEGKIGQFIWLTNEQQNK